jgi:hypothetical protein
MSRTTVSRRSTARWLRGRPRLGRGLLLAGILTVALTLAAMSVRALPAPADDTSAHRRPAVTSANACHMRATARLLGKLNLAVVLTLGDNQAENGTRAKFRRAYDRSWGRLTGRTRPAPGNHDYRSGGAAGYFGYFGAAAGRRSRGYYSFDVGPGI